MSPESGPILAIGAQLLPISTGGMAGVYIMIPAKGEPTFHFTRIALCVPLADMAIHEPAMTIVAVRDYAQPYMDKALAAYRRWSQREEEQP